MRIAKRMAQIFGGIFLSLVLLLALALVVINNINCSKHTDRISGLLEKYSAWDAKSLQSCEFHLGLTTRMEVGQLALVQTAPNSILKKVAIEKASVAIRILPLLFKQRIVLEEARFQGGDFHMQLSKPTEQVESEGIEAILNLLGSLYIRDAEARALRFTYLGEDPKQPLKARIERLSVKAAASEQPVLITGEGEAMDLPFTLKGEAGSLEIFNQSDSVYPLQAKVNMADQDLDVQASFKAQEGTQELKLTLAGSTLKAFSKLAGRDLSAVPAYKMAMELHHKAKAFVIPSYTATLGRSHVYGDARLELNQERPYLKAKMGASLLRFQDLISFAGPTKAREKLAEKAAEKANKDEPVFSREKIPSDIFSLLDADLNVSIAEYTGEAAGQVIDGAKAEIALKSGRLSIKPMKLSLASGTIEGHFVLDAQAKPMRIDTDIHLKRIDLQKLFAPFAENIPVFDLKPTDLIKGRIAGHINLQTDGSSPHELAQQLDGGIRLGVEDGKISATVIEAFGFDLTEALASWLADHPFTDLQCMITAFDIKAGRIDTKAFLLGTADTNIIGSGFIDLGKEEMDFKLEAKPKDFSIGSYKAPIVLQGPFRDLSFARTRNILLGRGAAAVALGALVNPLAAVLPFIEPGLEKEGRCAQYVGRIGKIQKQSEKKL